MAEPADHNAETQEPPSPVRLRSWPLRDSTARSAAVAAALLVAAILVYWFTGRILVSLAAMAALAVALWRFFLPIEFELSDAGVVQQAFGRRRRIPWRAIARFEVCSAGVLLMPDADRSATAPLRGLYLPFGDHRDEVLAIVRHYHKLAKREPTETRKAAVAEPSVPAK